MKWIICPWMLLISSLLIAGCSSSSGTDTIATQKPVNAGSYPDCMVCHASQNSSYLDPLVTNGLGTAGKHVLHVSGRGIDCVKCHFNYTNQATHMNGTMETVNPLVQLVFFDETNSSGKWNRSADPRTGQCSSVACHGAGTPDWYSASTTLPDCGACHAGSYDPAIIDVTAGGKHSRHVSDYRIACMKCHYGYTDQLTHMNGALDTVSAGGSVVYFDATIAGGQWNSSGPQAGSCSNLYCHSDATSLATGTIVSSTTPSWGAVSFPMACNKWTGESCLTAGCHQYGFIYVSVPPATYTYTSCSVCHGSNTRPALTKTSYPSNPHKCYGCHGFPPTYTPDVPKANSHWIHAGSSFTCNYCHYATTTNDSTITGTSKHANGSYDVIANPNSSYAGVAVSFIYSFDSGGGSCRNISCHIARGSGNNETWGGRAGVTAYIATAPYTQLTACYQIVFSGRGLGGTPPYTYYWSFSDGATSTEQNPVHAFPMVPYGYYSATLTVRDVNRHPNTTTFTGLFPNVVCQGTYPDCTWLKCW